MLSKALNHSKKVTLFALRDFSSKPNILARMANVVDKSTFAYTQAKLDTITPLKVQISPFQ